MQSRSIKGFNPPQTSCDKPTPRWPGSVHELLITNTLVKIYKLARSIYIHYWLALLAATTAWGCCWTLIGMMCPAEGPEKLGVPYFAMGQGRSDGSPKSLLFLIFRDWHEWRVCEVVSSLPKNLFTLNDLQGKGRMTNISSSQDLTWSRSPSRSSTSWDVLICLYHSL